MSDVYVAPEPHRCDVSNFFWTLDNDMRTRPDGSIWRCDECGTYWVKDISWHRVRWTDFTARSIIRELEKADNVEPTRFPIPAECYLWAAVFVAVILAALLGVIAGSAS